MSAVRSPRRSASGVPRLDLAPKLRRPLQPWNPLDYLRLLYWVFFFPQAIRWYVETFARPESRKATGRDLLPALREDPVVRNLIWMIFLLIVLTPVALAAGLHGIGISIDWLGMAVGVWFGVVAGGALGVVRGVAVGVAVSVAVSVAVGVAVGVAADAPAGMGFGVAFGVAAGVTVSMVRSVAFGVTAGVAVNMVRSVGFDVAAGITVGIVASVVAGIVTGVVAGVAVDIESRVAAGVGSSVAALVGFSAAFGITVPILLLRLLDYLGVLLLTAIAGSQRGGPMSHVTPIPLPGMRRRLEAWLEEDWAAGVHNVNQILAYTLQFIPAVEAVNRVLARMPKDRILPAVVELSRNPYDWDLVRFGFASLSLGALSLDVEPWQKGERSALELRLDTPAQFACAGFWYLHKKQPEKAAEAFARLQHLPYGAEMAGIASALALALAAKAPGEIAALLLTLKSAGSGGIPSLRPGTLSALRQLWEVAREVDTAHRAVSPALRSSAVGRAVGALTRLIDTATEICEPPEGELVREVAVRWRDLLARWGEEIGEEILLQPVENPFAEGASGRPVRRTFVGRGEVLARLERWWSGPPDAPLPVVILYGHRRMGKTSILLHLLETRPPHLLVAPTDMQDLIAADHTGQLLFKLAEAIHRAAAPALNAGPPPDPAEYATFGQATIALNRLLERLAPQMAGRRLILTVDEYELAEEKIEQGKFDPGFLRYLRAALTRHPWLNLILAGRQRLAEELRHYHAVFYGSAEPVRVTFLSREEAIALIRRPTDDFTLDIEEPLAEEIYRLTHGQPYLIQRLCYELVERWNERFRREGRQTPRRLTVADLQAILTPEFFRGFFLTAEYYFSGVWEEAGPDGQRLLRALAQWGEGASVGREELFQAAGLDPATGEAALRTLLEHDLVVETEGGIQLAVPLMHPWLRMSSR